MKFYLIAVILFFYHSMALSKISVSSQRLFLDLKNKSTEFQVRNTSALDNNCKINFNHYRYDDRGDLFTYTDPTFIPENSASNIIRFSPKRFTLLAKSSQKIRLNLRNKRDVTAQEYRTHMVVVCEPLPTVNDKILSNKFANISIKPLLALNIPLVARPRKLNAKISIDNISEAPNNMLMFDIKRSGNRSIYGKVNVFNEDNEIVTSSRSFPLYHETTSKPLSINLPKFKGNTLKLEFVEDERLSGKLVTSTIYNVK